MRKRLLSTLLALCMALILMPISVFAVEIVDSGVCGECEGKVTWTLDADGILDISGNGIIENTMYDSDFHVAWIKNKNEDLIKKVVIHDGVTSIENGAFSMCSNLTNVTFPTSVANISNSVFYGCNNLSDVYYSGTKAQWEQIDIRNDFDENVALLNATIHCNDGDIPPRGIVPAKNRCGNDLTWELSSDGTLTIQGTGDMWTFDIDQTAPWWDTPATGLSIKKVVLKNGVTSVGYNVFSGCFNLTSVFIPSSVTKVEEWAFSGSENLKDVCYSGTEAQWKQVSIHDDWDGSNTPLLNATIHYNSAGIDSKPIAPTLPPTSMGTGFADVAANAYYAAPVSWAVKQGITNGTSANQFSPNQTCTNAQILTFLWRAYGESEPTIRNPFPDDIPLAFAKAAIWAYENKMISGSTFDVNTPCTRAMAVTYMWLAAGSPTNVAPASFTDVPPSANYAQAVAWAVANNITNGTSDNQFSPNATCTRAQIMTFLYRFLAE